MAEAVKVQVPVPHVLLLMQGKLGVQAAAVQPAKAQKLQPVNKEVDATESPYVQGT